MVKINLGCGADYKEGYINVDDFSMGECRVDVKQDILQYQIPYESAEEILMSHVAMYIRPEEMKVLLKNCYNGLINGGKMIIETIDLKKVMKIALEESDPFLTNHYGLDNIFGTINTGVHRWGWMPDKLSLQLYNAGFSHLDYMRGQKKPDRDYMLIATK